MTDSPGCVYGIAEKLKLFYKVKASYVPLMNILAIHV